MPNEFTVTLEIWTKKTNLISQKKGKREEDEYDVTLRVYTMKKDSLN